LAPFAQAYGLELKERGYTPRTAVNQLRQVARLSRWLEASGLTVAELSVHRIEEFLAVQRADGRHRSSWSRPGLLCLLDVLRARRVLLAEDRAVPASPTEVLLAGFERHLCAERGLAAGTVRGYVGHARQVGGHPGRVSARADHQPAADGARPAPRRHSPGDPGHDRSPLPFPAARPPFA
jgi:integrase/recombinase XerD